MFKNTQQGVTLSLFFDERRKNKEGKYPVKFMVCYKRQQKYYSVGIYITKEEYGALVDTKKRELVQVRTNIEKAYLKIKHHIEALLSADKFSVEALTAQLEGVTDKTVSEAFAAKIAHLIKNGQVGTANSYQGAINSLASFAGMTIKYSDVTISWLNSYEQHMIDKGCSSTTIGIYLRALRVIFNEAIAANYVATSAYPFGKRGYSIPIGEGRKLALTLAQVKQIFEYKTDNEATQKYLDLWRFSYLCNGANINDILQLKYANIQGEEIFFVREKTSRTSKKRKEIAAYIVPEMQQIIDNWGNPNKRKEEYIFPYLNGVTDIKKQKVVIRDVIKRINKRMVNVSKELNLPHITTYTARHSYATVLKRSGANIAFISESLGHSDLKTTESYLASFETEERKKNAELLTRF